jgi:hypothetical protein
MREKRAESRAGIMARIEVLWGDKDGTARIAPAKLEDKSRGGASIRVKDPIGVGTHVTVQWQNGHFSGTVAYCDPLGNEYVLGIRRFPAQGLDSG